MGNVLYVTLSSFCHAYAPAHRWPVHTHNRDILQYKRNRASIICCVLASSNAEISGTLVDFWKVVAERMTNPVFPQALLHWGLLHGDFTCLKHEGAQRPAMRVG